MKSFKSFATKTVFIAFLFINSGNSLLAQKQPETQMAQAADGNIRFAGIQEDMLIFEVQFENLPAKGTVLNIFNESGDPIFTEKISATFHNCRYKIIRNNTEMITFTVSGKAFYYNQSFTINHKIEEKLEVKKLN